MGSKTSTPPPSHEETCTYNIYIYSIRLELWGVRLLSRLAHPLPHKRKNNTNCFCHVQDPTSPKSAAQAPPRATPPPPPPPPPPSPPFGGQALGVAQAASAGHHLGGAGGCGPPRRGRVSQQLPAPSPSPTELGAQGSMELFSMEFSWNP